MLWRPVRKQELKKQKPKPKTNTTLWHVEVSKSGSRVQSFDIFCYEKLNSEQHLHFPCLLTKICEGTLQYCFCSIRQSWEKKFWPSGSLWKLRDSFSRKIKMTLRGHSLYCHDRLGLRVWTQKDLLWWSVSLMCELKVGSKELCTSEKLSSIRLRGIAVCGVKCPCVPQAKCRLTGGPGIAGVERTGCQAGHADWGNFCNTPGVKPHELLSDNKPFVVGVGFMHLHH